MGEKESMPGEALRESPSKASTGQTALRESPTRQSTGREASAPSVSEGVVAPRDVATGQSSGRMGNIGSSGQDGAQVDIDPNLGSSGQERGVVGGAVPGGSILSAAVSSVGELDTDVATGDLDGDGAAETKATKTRSNIQNN